MIRPPAALALLLRELTAWARGRRERMRVEGRSMLPTLADGDMVLIDAARTARCGDLVAARPEALAGVAVVKRITALGADGAAILSSDNPGEGTDSRTWGPVPPDRLDGVVTVELGRRRLLIDDSVNQPADQASPWRWLRR